MLISGPPGLGKTTLAHVVAKQAGYGVYEINARYEVFYASSIEIMVLTFCVVMRVLHRL